MVIGCLPCCPASGCEVALRGSPVCNTAVAHRQSAHECTAILVHSNARAGPDGGVSGAAQVGAVVTAIFGGIHTYQDYEELGRLPGFSPLLPGLSAPRQPCGGSHDPLTGRQAMQARGANVIIGVQSGPAGLPVLPC
jgi:hypothetical protein